MKQLLSSIAHAIGVEMFETDDLPEGRHGQGRNDGIHGEEKVCMIEGSSVVALWRGTKLARHIRVTETACLGAQ